MTTAIAENDLDVMTETPAHVHEFVIPVFTERKSGTALILMGFARACKEQIEVEFFSCVQ